jgi:CrcB protein
MSDPRPPGNEPASTDPDVDLRDVSQRREYGARHPAVLGVIAVGGVLGALLRYQIGRWWPTPTDHFPSATLTINLTGCLAIGVLLGVIGEMSSPPPLLRPFLGTGVLGGFTTFSTYAVDIQTLLRHGDAGIALAYLFATAAGAVAAVGLGLYLGLRLFRRADGTDAGGPLR